jgi:hypothetical protein
MSDRPPEGWGQPQWGQQRPQAQSWGPVPNPQPPGPPKPKKAWCRRWWAIAGGILVVLMVIGIVTGEDPATETQPTTEQTQAPEPTRARANPETTEAPTSADDLGKPVRDGAFEFVVSRFRCRVNECAATMSVENIGNDPGTMFADNQYLFDTQGRRFSPNSSLTDSLLVEELNPGGSVRGTIRWNVPANFKPSHLELHDSAFSGGVEVWL